MKRTASALSILAVAVGLVVLPAISNVYAQSACSVATLSGNYALSHSGFTPKNTNGNKLPFALIGVFAFDGAGNFSITYTDVSPGPPSYVPLQGHGSGTYTVNSDCTGTWTCTTGDCAGATLNTVIIGGGQEGFFINMTPEVIGTGYFKKQ